MSRKRSRVATVFLIVFFIMSQFSMLIYANQLEEVGMEKEKVIESTQDNLSPSQEEKEEEISDAQDEIREQNLEATDVTPKADIKSSDKSTKGEVTEVTLASKESGLSSDFKQFHKIFESHNTGNLRVRMISNAEQSMFNSTMFFYITVPGTLNSFEIVGDVEGNENDRAIFDMYNILTRWENGFNLNGVPTVLNNIEVKGHDTFSIYGGNPGQNVDILAKDSILTGVIGTTVQQKSILNMLR